MSVAPERFGRRLEAPCIEVRALSFRWRPPEPFALRVPHFTLARGERLLLTGPSGSGKSTLLALLAGLAAPDAGSVAVLGNDLAALSARARDRLRAAQVGVVFQALNLLPYLSAVDNVLLPLHFAPARRNRIAAERSPRAEAARLLSRLGLPDDIGGRPATRLSIGEQQRVAAARALIGRPALILADEPLSALDIDHQAAFLELLLQEVAEAGTTLLMVGHDLRIAPHFDRTVRLADLIEAPAS